MTAKKKSTGKKSPSAVKKRKVVKKKASPKKTAAKGKSKTASKAETNSNPSMSLSPVLVINNAKALQQEIDNLLRANNDISIDVSAVEMIDTAILQLLLALALKQKSENHKVNWVNPSQIFRNNASLLGLSDSLGLS